MATIDLTKDNFQETIDKNEIVLIDFWADWCGPCKMFGPVFTAASEKHEDIAFCSCNTEEQQELAANFGIRSIPTLMIFRQKVLLMQQAGALPAEALDEVIQKVRDLDMDEIMKKIKEEEGED